MTLLNLDRTLDYINMFFLSVNIIFIIYIKQFVNKFKKKTSINLLNSRSKSFIDGILIIEFLFFSALYIWTNQGGDEALGGIADPSLLLYIIAEHVKTFYFLSIIILTWRDVKIDSDHISYALRDKDGL